jgi:hypothetical protein
MIHRASSGDPAIRDLLARHPRVGEALDDGTPGVRFRQGPWQREVRVGDAHTPLRGLVELIDNNPLVCADAISVPDPVCTLALIALGPLALAGLLVEAPMVQSNVPTDPDLLDAFLRTTDWDCGAVYDFEELDLGGAVAVTAIAAVVTPKDLADLDDLYDERFGRSFFVRRDESSSWDVGLVLEQPHACYRLRIAADEPHSLLTVRVLADLHGKAGAAQVVHAMNVMAGIEESLPFN